jgi:hypothetical protein
VDFGKALEDRDQSPVLALRDLEIDDVVVEIIFTSAGGDGDELFARRMDQDGPERADFRCDVDPGHGQES